MFSSYTTVLICPIQILICIWLCWLQLKQFPTSILCYHTIFSIFPVTEKYTVIVFSQPEQAINERVQEEELSDTLENAVTEDTNMEETGSSEEEVSS